MFSRAKLADEQRQEDGPDRLAPAVGLLEGPEEGDHVWNWNLGMELINWSNCAGYEDGNVIWNYMPHCDD
jgi:hypothetical protein